MSNVFDFKTQNKRMMLKPNAVEEVGTLDL